MIFGIISLEKLYKPQCISCHTVGILCCKTNLVKRYIRNHPMHKLKPNYVKYGSIAPLLCCRRLIDRADRVICFGNKRNLNIKYAVWYAKKSGKPIQVFRI